jgi:hypothetical protein
MDKAEIERRIEEVQAELKRVHDDVHGPDAPDAPKTARERALAEELRQLLIKQHGLE